MRKRVFGRKLNKDIDKRKRLFRNLMRSFIIYGKLKTTDAKAAAIRGEVEKIVTKAKRKGDGAFRDIQKRLVHEDITQRVIRDIAPVFADRPGGYTRVLKLGTRVKDAAPMVLLQWVEQVQPYTSVEDSRKEKGTKTPKTEKKEATVKTAKKAEGKKKSTSTKASEDKGKKESKSKKK